MATRSSLLDLDPEIQKGLEMATETIARILEGPDFQGKRIMELMAQGLTMSEILGISEKQLDLVFQKATQLLEAGRIEDSRKLFTMVMQLQPFEERYTYGLATTYQVGGDFR